MCKITAMFSIIYYPVWSFQDKRKTFPTKWLNTVFTVSVSVSLIPESLMVIVEIPWQKVELIISSLNHPSSSSTSIPRLKSSGGGDVDPWPTGTILSIIWSPTSLSYPTKPPSSSSFSCDIFLLFRWLSRNNFLPTSTSTASWSFLLPLSRSLRRSN